VSPSGGSRSGGSTVTVTGSGFAPGAGATRLKLGTLLGGSVECSSTVTCSVVVPSAKKAGAVDVTATVAKKTSAKSAADRYTYS
jgi:hypothetical protein